MGSLAQNHRNAAILGFAVCDACYGRGAPIFFRGFLILGAQDRPQELTRRKIKLLPDEKPHGPGKR